MQTFPFASHNKNIEDKQVLFSFVDFLVELNSFTTDMIFINNESEFINQNKFSNIVLTVLTFNQ